MSDHATLNIIAYASQRITEVRHEWRRYARNAWLQFPQSRRAMADVLGITQDELRDAIFVGVTTIEHLEERTESPVEKMFLRAIHPHVAVDPQHKVGPYRLDFAVVEHKIAVEVDGHDYHSTKKQRGRDSKRDRYLQSQGWRVFRFTGSEVYRDADGCAREILAVVNGGDS